MLQKDSNILRDYQQSTELEWLETNGLGGWSSSTIIGCNTRRYHGLLVAAVLPPTERINLVNKLDETLVVNGRRYEMATNNYGDSHSPNGYQYLSLFEKGLFPSWTYDIEGIRLKKTISMIHGENTVVILYEIMEANEVFSMELLPLLSVRGYHDLMHANNFVQSDAGSIDDVCSTTLYEHTPKIFIKIPGSTYTHHPNWYYHFNYSEEKNRGLDFVEDLFSQGHFTIQLQKGSRVGVILSTEDPAAKDAWQLFEKETTRRELLLSEPFNGSTLHYLTLAADQFIVKRAIDLKTVIAGYHWFTDWGRDTMIALPGLTLHTGRFEDARKIIAAFAQVVNMGMIPNRFPDHGEQPEYNNVDGTLWYFVVVYQYLQASGDQAFVLQEILPVLKDIINWHLKGTRFHIHATDQGLLYSGEPGQQLTWMDARIDDWVVTPRMGEPVEVQALWYNALKIFAYLLEINKDGDEAMVINALSEKTRTHFHQLFWNPDTQALFDNCNEDGQPDATIRPNQVIALALPFPLVTGERAASILQCIENKLYTPFGLRTLDPIDPAYKGIYEGDAWHRDSSYHQGTAWSWLLGPYIDSIIRNTGSISKAQQIIDQFRHHLSEGCIGSVSEIFDASAPFHPRGCIAQAWGVGEILRVMKQYGLH